MSQVPDKQNIFIFTAERANVYEKFPHVDFFVIDEFYKIGALNGDRKRTVALNQTFYKLAKGGAQFYLLGPCVKEIPEGFEQRFECRFFRTLFATVASEEKRISVSSADEIGALCDLVKSLKGDAGGGDAPFGGVRLGDGAACPAVGRACRHADTVCRRACTVCTGGGTPCTPVDTVCTCTDTVCSRPCTLCRSGGKVYTRHGTV